VIDPVAQARLERWKRSLLDLSTANRLLDVGGGPGQRRTLLTIPLPSLDPLAVAAALADGAAFAVESGPAVGGDAIDAGRLRTPLAKPELARRLVAIRRAARAQLADGGVHTLWLGLGMLVWSEEPSRGPAAEAGAVGDLAAHAVEEEPAVAVGAVEGVAAIPGSRTGGEKDGPGAEPREALDDAWTSPVELEGPPDATIPRRPPEPLDDALRARSSGAAPHEGPHEGPGEGPGEGPTAVLRRAPLALWPVELVREPGGFRLVEVAGVDPRINQTLREKLRREIGAVLPDDDAGGDELDLAGLLAAAEAIAAARPGWRVERAAELGIFGFAKFVMWNDLDARAGELLESPVVAHLAAGAGTAFAQPTPAAEDAIAAPGSPEAGARLGDLIAPLDADASQLAAVAAAAAGASFVLQGPPGTGKSQTIANLIAHAVSHGKTVLFVTDKVAALDVVHQRLAAVGLGEVCLALHSHRAVRAQVVGQLGRVLERAFRPLGGPAGADARLAELRAALDHHAAAMHRVGPFGSSLHDVLGRLVELRSAPRAALAERDATGLDRASFERRRIAVGALAAAAVAVEPVAAHPWRASTLARWPLDGRERVLAALDAAAVAAVELAAALREVEQGVPGIVGRTRDQLIALGRLAGLAAASPRPGAELLTQLRVEHADDAIERIALIRARGGGAIEPPRDPGSFLVLASRHRLLVTEVNDRFTDSVAELDAAALWTQLRRWARRLAPLRYLALRETRAAIRAAAMPGMLETDGAMITALESVIAERAARAALVAAAGPARRWFGELGGDPLALDLAKIDAAVGWAAELRLAFDAVEVAQGGAGRAAAWRALVAQVAASPAASAGPAGDAAAGELAAFARLDGAVRRWRPALAALAEATGIDEAQLGGGGDHLEALGLRIEALRHAVDALRDWVAFHGARTAALAAGVGPAVGAIERGDLGAAELAEAWERAALLAWADAELADTPALARFHGAEHHARVAAFGDLDRAALVQVRARAIAGIAERVPRVTAEPGGELGVLLRELQKQRGHRPLRRLFAEIPALLPRLAPCLLMSPLSVAQYLDPALPRFDLVVFDEASQLPTADAIGALARGDAAVVVGDSRQLPPTRFFAAGAAGDDGDADAAAEGEAAELDSVLEDCVAARLPELPLTWHYRSRHEDLIAFANRRYYADRLQVFPAAHGSPDLGVAWRRVDGIYDRGGTRQNRIEAEAVAAEVIARLRDPVQRARSLGVVTFSRAQQELIEDLLDAARADDEQLDGWFEAGPGGEPVLVKNLEAIQGDERDVVILSVGYGPDDGGAFTRHLGPLSQRGGERRLNVAITRAREQLIVMSSFAPDDLAGATGQGVQDLAALLAFARDGGGAARPAAAEAAAPASPVTAAIARALVERGWTVRHQVGCGAYRIDLAIVDPSDPDRYVLAIETDGAAYAGAATARDRDRLRPQMLGQLGWRLHRIWALDWWADPEREVQRAHGAIVAAVAASRQRRASAPPPGKAPSPRPGEPAAGAASLGSAPRRRRPAASGAAGSAPPATSPPVAAGSGPTEPLAALLGGRLAPEAAGSAPIRLARNAIAIGPYMAAAVPAGRRAPEDLFAPRHLGEVGKIIEQVLAAEAPIHLDVLARRVGAYFGIGRLTQRVTDQVRVALAGRGRWGDEDDIVWRLDQDPAGVPAVRVAGQGASARREIHEVPLAEVAAAARIVVERAVGIATAELVRDAARLLGFSRTTERVVERVATGVRIAAQRELIRIEGGRATLPD
jgi:very-short-patch-repair endonuclease